ncbi:ABC transporter ATP-binding protein [Cocleimonas flava]|uniref:Putative ABC transport system ATP-binding protein n=1 Tax=Cocleimonas flava TaxID=634765 RepID=A0A4R1EP26_9GAMM|nr:ABC transporter ATP-binding protein [Cocleimonas flava]TCJ82733.1 putative ABC transport system ATP-binding protein [Cocleimonas flava]
MTSKPAKTPHDVTSKTVVDLRQLSFSYDLQETKLDVLVDVDLTLNQGETVAILGPSGSGKTSLLLLLAGLEQPTSGAILIDDKDLAKLDADALADLRRDSLGIVFQSFHLVPSLTALGNVMLPLEIAERDNVEGKNAREVATTMLERVGLAERGGHYPTQLSGGEQQRVAIARALVHTPRLLLADEPMGNLDAKTGERIIELLFGLNRESGSTMILVTHDESIAAQCQRVFRLQQGKLVEDAPHAVST